MIPHRFLKIVAELGGSTKRLYEKTTKTYLDGVFRDFVGSNPTVTTKVGVLKKNVKPTNLVIQPHQGNTALVGILKENKTRK